MAQALVSVSGQPIEGSKLRVTLELIAGRNAEINNLTEPAGDERYRLIHQAYASYPLTESLTLDFGKFLTWVGYETATSGDNPNYSRSHLFAFAEPLYHTGLRVSGTVAPGWTAGAALVNGWNEVENSNGQLSYGANVGYAPDDKLSLSAAWFGGTEGGPDSGGGIGFPSDGKQNVSLWNLNATYLATPELKVGASWVMADARRVGRSASGKWDGAAAYAQYQVNEAFSLAARYDVFSDRDGLRLGEDARLNGLTLTANYKVDKALTLRLEWREDRSNRSLYPSDDGDRRTQRSLSLSAFVRF